MEEFNSLLRKIGKAINIAGNVILMNLLFLVSALPIVTIGQAWCALLAAIRYRIRGDRWFDGFKQGFKTRFWRGILSWCIMLIPNVYMLLEVHYGFAMGYTVQLIASSFVFAMSAMMTVALLVLNVYIPTKIGIWIETAAKMVFTVPLELFGSAVLFWLPVLLGLLWFDVFYGMLMILLAVYFCLAALVVTILLKNSLMQTLLAARANGSLLAEEGKVWDEEDEAEEDDGAEDA